VAIDRFSLIASGISFQIRLQWKHQSMRSVLLWECLACWAVAVVTAATCLHEPVIAQANAKPAEKQLAKFEPADGQTYHGICLPGSWDEKEFAANLAAYRKMVPQPPLVLHSWFAHCQEKGKWRTWHWMADTPDGLHGGGPMDGYAEISRKNGMVPLIAWAWMEYPDEGKSPKLQDMVAGKYDWYLDEWIAGIKEFKDPIFIRLSHEMDGDWYPYS
jgi:hypothetical protein